MQLASRAAEVLVGNDTGTMVTAAPRLYPHMWSWDTAFISIGLAHLSVSRAARELETLLAAQWRDGMLPHIVFGPNDGYFPGPSRWACAALNPSAPSQPATSGICAPPVHALALRRVVDIGLSRGDSSVTGPLSRLWPRLYRWHAWLARYRDPDGSGLLSIVHGWESGMDNSPRWDLPYAAVHPDASLPPYVRLDRSLVADPAERPGDADYDRYLWLIEELRAAATTRPRWCAPPASWSATYCSAPCSRSPAKSWPTSVHCAQRQNPRYTGCAPGPRCPVPP